MNESVHLHKYKLWLEFESLIANKLNSEKNTKDKQALFLFLDSKVTEIQAFSKQLKQYGYGGESLLIPQIVQINELVTKLRLLKESMNHPFVLYVMGMGNVGKSSLLNLLVGSNVADVDALPKTWKTDFFYLVNQPTDVIVKYRSDKDSKKVSYETAKKMVQEEETKREGSEDEIVRQFRQLSRELTLTEDKTNLKNELSEKLLYRSDIKEIQWGVENLPEFSILRQFSIVDTPGLSQNNYGMHREHIGDFYHQADGILWLLDSTSISASKPKQILEQLTESLKHVGQQSQNMLAVLNQIDKVRKAGGVEAVNSVVSAAKEIFDGHFLDVLPCSAKEALQAQQNNDEKLLEQSGYPLLLNRIQKYFYDNAFSLRIEGKANNFVGILETHRQDSEPFLKRFTSDIDVYDDYYAKISADLARFKAQYEKDWEACFSSYRQKIQVNIGSRAKAYVDLQEEQDKAKFVQSEIFEVSELEKILSNFQREKANSLERYIQQQHQKISKSFERFSLINKLKPALLMNSSVSTSIYKTSTIDFSSSEKEGVLVGGAAAGVAMLLLGPVGLIAGAIGFFWSQSRKVDKAKESFRLQLTKIHEDSQKNISQFLEKLFKQQQHEIFQTLNKQFSALYAPRKDVEEILEVFERLEQMKLDKFDRVTFQDFILGKNK